MGSKEMWRLAREVILEGVHKDGTFLDIGCANGVLARDLCVWAKERNINLIPFGIDIDKELIKECKRKLPKFKMNFIVAHRCKFKPNMKFTFICTYFSPKNWWKRDEFLKSCLEMLEPGGRLILTRYDDKIDEFLLLEEYLRENGPKLGFSVVGSAEVKGMTKVFWVKKEEKLRVSLNFLKYEAKVKCVSGDPGYGREARGDH